MQRALSGNLSIGIEAFEKLKINEDAPHRHHDAHTPFAPLRCCFREHGGK
jgi:hypothetical protein